MQGELKVGNAVIIFAETGRLFSLMNAGMFIYVDNADVRLKKTMTVAVV
jgi:hypothetical protein